MKSINYLIISILIFIPLVFQGCSPDGNKYESKGNLLVPTIDKTIEIKIATGGVGGTYFYIGSAISSILTQEVENVVATPLSTGASIANLTLLNSKKVDLILAASNSTQRAYIGTPPFSKPETNLRAIASLYPEIFHFISKKDLPIDSINDIKGLRVSLGPKEGGTSSSAKEIIMAHGIDFEKDIKVDYLSFSEAVFALEADQIDVAIIATGIPNTIVSEIAEVMEIKLLNLDEEKFKKYIEKQPYMFISTIPQNTYLGIEQEVIAASSPALLVTTNDKGEEIVYRITKSILSNTEVLSKSHEQGKNIKLENALQGISIPLHEGAKKYYMEQGIEFNGD